MTESNESLVEAFDSICTRWLRNDAWFAVRFNRIRAALEKIDKDSDPNPKPFNRPVAPFPSEPSGLEKDKSYSYQKCSCGCGAYEDENPHTEPSGLKKLEAHCGGKLPVDPKGSRCDYEWQCEHDRLTFEEVDRRIEAAGVDSDWVSFGAMLQLESRIDKKLEQLKFDIKKEVAEAARSIPAYSPAKFQFNRFADALEGEE